MKQGERETGREGGEGRREAEEGERAKARGCLNREETVRKGCARVFVWGGGGGGGSRGPRAWPGLGERTRTRRKTRSRGEKWRSLSGEWGDRSRRARANKIRGRSRLAPHPSITDAPTRPRHHHHPGDVFPPHSVPPFPRPVPSPTLRPELKGDRSDGHLQRLALGWGLGARPVPPRLGLRGRRARGTTTAKSTAGDPNRSLRAWRTIPTLPAFVTPRHLASSSSLFVSRAAPSREGGGPLPAAVRG